MIDRIRKWLQRSDRALGPPVPEAGLLPEAVVQAKHWRALGFNPRRGWHAFIHVWPKQLREAQIAVWRRELDAIKVDMRRGASRQIAKMMAAQDDLPERRYLEALLASWDAATRRKR